MATSEVDICNSALAKVGAARISSLSDDSSEARLCNELYEGLRDELLRSHPWNFAVERVQIAQTVNTPVFGYDYSFALPTDCLRVLDTSFSESSFYQWKIEGRTLLSNCSTASILYIKKVTAVEEYDTTFNEALAYRLAVDLATGLKRDAAMSLRMDQSFEKKMALARSYNGQEGSVSVVQAKDWLNRYRS